MLRSLEVPFEVMERPLPDEIKVWVHEARERVQAFQDRWDRPQIEQQLLFDLSTRRVHLRCTSRALRAC